MLKIEKNSKKGAVLIIINRLDIALTTLCNFTCSYCRGNPGERTKLPYNEVITIIDNFYELGVRNIQFRWWRTIFIWE